MYTACFSSVTLAGNLGSLKDMSRSPPHIHTTHAAEPGHQLARALTSLSFNPRVGSRLFLEFPSASIANSISPEARNLSQSASVTNCSMGDRRAMQFCFSSFFPNPRCGGVRVQTNHSLTFSSPPRPASRPVSRQVSAVRVSLPCPPTRGVPRQKPATKSPIIICPKAAGWLFHRLAEGWA